MGKCNCPRWGLHSVAGQDLLALEPRLVGYVAGLKDRFPGKAVRALKRLRSLVRDYPRAPLLKAVIDAMTYGMYDLDRLEGMVLRNVRRDYFVLRETVATETSHER